MAQAAVGNGAQGAGFRGGRGCLDIDRMSVPVGPGKGMLGFGGTPTSTTTFEHRLCDYMLGTVLSFGVQ